MTTEDFWAVVLAVALTQTLFGLALASSIGFVAKTAARRKFLEMADRLEHEAAMRRFGHTGVVPESPITGGIPDDDFEREVERRMREELSRLAKDKPKPVGTTPWEAEGKVRPPDQPEQF